VTIETVDFTFSPSATCKKKRPPLSWHLRMEEQAEIESAWNSIRNSEQGSESTSISQLVSFPPQADNTHGVA